MKFVRHRRGLSNVVTAAIMLTSVAVMGSGLVAWSHGNLSAFQHSLANTASTQTNQINENLIIEQVVFCKKQCPHNDFLHLGFNITVTNTGSEGLTVSSIKINGTNYPSIPFSLLPFKLAPHQSYTWGHANINWNSKDPETITVTTNRTTIITTQVVAP